MYDHQYEIVELDLEEYGQWAGCCDLGTKVTKERSRPVGWTFEQETARNLLTAPLEAVERKYVAAMKKIVRDDDESRAYFENILATAASRTP